MRETNWAAIVSKWGDEVRHVARELVLVCLSEDWFTPEGLELYEWYWVPADRHTFRMSATAPEKFVTALPSEPSAYGPDMVVEIGTIMQKAGVIRGIEFTARMGWNTDERVAVLFFAGGGQLEEV